MSNAGTTSPVRRLRYTRRALADIEAIRIWLTQPGAGQAAKRKLRALRASIRLLREHPYLYALGQHPGVRELPCAGGYRALYRVSPDIGDNNAVGDVVVLRVFGPGQDRSAL